MVAAKDETAHDLLNPKWKGTIAWSTAPSSGAAVYVGSVLQTMGEGRAWISCARSPSRISSISTPPTARYSIR